jgi:hypothetical protein
MSGKYYMNTSTDVTTLCASKVHDAAPGFAASGSLFNGESTFQKAGSLTTNVTLTGYQDATSGTATTITAVKKGYYPQVTANFGNAFWSSGTAGTYTITRSDSSLTVGSSTFYPADFRDGVIPSQVALFLAAGGAGGGGNGYYKKDKDNYPRVPGSGGGGGGMILGWIDLTVSGTKVITVGAGGAAGSNGTSGSTSKGSSGTAGGKSSYTVGGTERLWANSGVAGGAATVGDGSYTHSGSPIGGSGSYASGTGLIRSSYSIKGSNGCTAIYDANHEYWANNSSNKISSVKDRLMTDTGAPEVEIVTEKYWGLTNSTDKIGSNTWYAGGNSYSAGAHYDGVGWYEYCNTPGGGGGGSGELRCAGANGIAILCY